jgi:type VI protein secretion system component VasF
LGLPETSLTSLNAEGPEKRNRARLCFGSPSEAGVRGRRYQQKGNLPLWGIFVVVSMMSLIMGLLMLVLVFIRAQGCSSRFISTPANR